MMAEHWPARISPAALAIACAPRAADAVDRQGGHMHGKSASDGRLARRVHARTSLHDLPQDHAVHRARRQACTTDHGADRRRAQVGGRRVLQGAAEGTDRRAHRMAEKDVGPTSFSALGWGGPMRHAVLPGTSKIMQVVVACA